MSRKTEMNSTFKPEDIRRQLAKYYKAVSELIEEEQAGKSTSSPLLTYYRQCAIALAPESVSFDKKLFCPNCHIRQIEGVNCTVQVVEGKEKRKTIRQKRIQRLRKIKKKSKIQERLLTHLIQNKFGFKKITCTCGYTQKKQQNYTKEENCK